MENLLSQLMENSQGWRGRHQRQRTLHTKKHNWAERLKVNHQTERLN